MKSDELFIHDIVERAAYAPSIDVDTTGVVAGAVRHRKIIRSLVSGGALAAIAFAAVAVTGLPQWTSEPVPAASSTWEPPAWLSQETALREAVRQELQTCMDTKGWEVTMDESGGAAEPFDSQERLDSFGRDRDDCLVHVAEVVPRTEEVPAVSAYERDLVTRQCVEAQGYEVDAAPSEAQDQRGATADPYDDPALRGLSQRAFDQLRATCPERWSFPDQVPTFAGPHAAEYTQFYSDTRSDLVRDVLADEEITAAEYAEMTARFTACLADKGITFEGFDAEGFTTSIAPDGGDTHALVSDCSASSGEQWIGALYTFERETPEEPDSAPTP